MLAAVVGTVMGPRQPANGEPPCLRTGAASALHRARQDAPAAWQAPGGHRHRWPCRPAGWYAVVPAPRHGTAVSSGHHAQRLRLEEMQDAGFRPRRAVPQPKPRQQVRQSAASCPAGRIPVPGGVPQHRRAGSALPGRKPAGCHQPVLPAPQPWHPAAASQLPEAREPVQAPFPTPQACDGATLTMPVAETVTAAQPPVRHRGACRRRAGHLSASPPAHRSRQQPYPIHPPPPAGRELRQPAGAPAPNRPPSARTLLPAASSVHGWPRPVRTVPQGVRAAPRSRKAGQARTPAVPPRPARHHAP